MSHKSRKERKREALIDKLRAYQELEDLIAPLGADMDETQGYRDAVRGVFNFIKNAERMVKFSMEMAGLA